MRHTCHWHTHPHGAACAQAALEWWERVSSKVPGDAGVLARLGALHLKYVGQTQATQP